MTVSYHLQKVPVEYVQPGFCVAVLLDGRYRLFRVECTQMSHRRGQPVMFKLTSEPIDGGDPWVVEYQAGTAVIRIVGAYTAAS